MSKKTYGAVFSNGREAPQAAEPVPADTDVPAEKKPAQKAFPKAKKGVTREQWLNAGILELKAHLESCGPKLPKNVRVSVGFPVGSRAGSVIDGQVFNTHTSKDGHFEIFISPRIDYPVKALSTLTHELIHTAVGFDAKHGPKFRQVALEMGLEGPMTSTEAGPDLVVVLEGIIGKLGGYPHAAMDLTGDGAGSAGKTTTAGPQKQSTRMHKVYCEDCGYTIRVAQKWIEQGLPTCACGEPMTYDAE